MNENRRAIWSWAFIDGANSAFTLLVTTALAKVVTQFVRFSAVIAFGRLGEKIGARRGILLGVAVYVGLCFSAAQMTTSLEFFFMALVVGLVQGGVQSLSRSYFAQLIPAEKGGEYFRFLPGLESSSPFSDWCCPVVRGSSRTRRATYSHFSLCLWPAVGC